MNLRYLVAFALLVLFGLHSAARAYELQTHRWLTLKALERSEVKLDPSVMQDLGLKPADDLTQLFRNSQDQQRTVSELFRDGAELEDDFFPRNPLTIRVLRHFYNPITGAGLEVSLLPPFKSSPDWALAPRGSDSNQEFSYWDARQQLFDGLTKVTEEDRSKALGLSFQALGHVVHHIQDMAQPAHVRNDLHCSIPKVCLALPFLPFSTPSFFEKWTELGPIRGNLPIEPASVGYDIRSPLYRSTFNNPRRFWNTEPSGKGMAEFTNRNFVSAGTNFFWTGSQFAPNQTFALPAPDPLAVERADIKTLVPQSPFTGEVWFVRSLGFDNFVEQDVDNRRAATFSIFSEDLSRRFNRRVLTLNAINFEEAYRHLIPRAVAHSAGMINYFFRGKMDLKKDEQDTSKFRIVNLGDEVMNGRFGLYYDAKDGNRYPVQVDPADPNRRSDGTSWFLSINKLDPAVPNGNLSDPISFIPPPTDESPTATKAVNTYLLVFNGNMGEEREDPTKGVIGAVAAKALKAEIDGVLYVKVLRTDNSQRVLKVDKTGTRYLEDGELNPLEHFSPGGGRSNRSNWQAALYKQVEYKPLAFGGQNYKVLSFAIPNSLTGQHTSFVRDENGNLVRRFRPISWVAKNTASGDFEFGLNDIPFFEGQSTLVYTRRYKENGQVKVEQGTAPWPSFRSLDQDNQAGLVHSLPAVSADGLRIGGYIEVQPSVTIVNTGTEREDRKEMVEHVVTVTPGPVPAASEAPVSRGITRSGRQVTVRAQGTTNRFFVDCGEAVETTITLPAHIKEQHFNRTIHGIGAGPDGQSRFVEYVNEDKLEFAQDIVDNVYPLCDGSLRFVGQSDLTALTTVTTSITGESGSRQAVAESGNNLLHAFQAPYDMINTRPPLVPKPFNPGHTLELIQTMGANGGDAIVNDIGAGNLKFRSTPIDFFWVGDVSPVGEIFLTSEDGKTVIHEPLQGGIQKIQMPPDVRKVLGALWL